MTSDYIITKTGLKNICWPEKIGGGENVRFCPKEAEKMSLHFVVL
jgi:hypothetical protein